MRVRLSSNLSYISVMIVSIPFLVATFLVYALVPELQNMNGKCLMFYVAGMIVYSITLPVTNLMQHTNNCVALGYLTYFALMVSFFWVNVMCFDIWLTFRGIRMASKQMRHLLYYICYGIGGPLVMVTIGVIVDSTDWNWRPKIGDGQCFLASKIGNSQIK
jgi:G protein-coupled receptor Mth (Methuselah protein)